jgi:hypothetical protein
MGLNILSKSITYDGVNVLRWNFEVKPFVARWIIQTKENTHKLGAIENHMLPWGVGGKGRCCCQFMLMFQGGRNIDQP